jgi:hypothetical protein
VTSSKRTDAPGGRRRQRLRRGRRDDRRLHLQQLHQPLGRAGGAQQVAVHLGKHRDAAHQDDHVDDGLAEVAGADVAAHDRLRALVEAPEEGAEGRADDEGDQERAHPRAPHGGAEGALGRGREAVGLAPFLQVALHHRHRVQHLGGDRARVGDPVLARAREAAHAPAEIERRQDDQHQDHEHLGHDDRVGDDQHRHRADAHDRVAQAHRQARADDGLDQRRVGRQARQHLAGLRRLEELRALADDVRVDGVAQVGGDALAEPAHHVEARRRKDAERDADREEGEEVLAQRHHARARVGGDESLVDQRLQRDRKDQRADGGEDEERAPRRRRAPGRGRTKGAGRRASGRCERSRQRARVGRRRAGRRGAASARAAV